MADDRNTYKVKDAHTRLNECVKADGFEVEHGALVFYDYNTVGAKEYTVAFGVGAWHDVRIDVGI